MRKNNLFHLPILNRALLRDLFLFNASLGIYRFLKGIDYVRSIEFPVIIDAILKRRNEPLSYLDIGSGNSILPTYVATHSSFRVTVIDRYRWISDQIKYLMRLGKEHYLFKKRFVMLKDDFIKNKSLQNESFDIITAVSVLEHMENNGDSEAVAKIHRLLKPEGILLLTAPYNHFNHLKFYVNKSVYGQSLGPKGFFYQRHYNTDALANRILNVASFHVEALFYCGHYDNFNFAKHLYMLPTPLKGIKIFYNWAAPFYAPYFMKLSYKPPYEQKPGKSTADTVFVFMKKIG